MSGGSKADRATTEFVAVAAHELRTPLTSIKAYTLMLLEQRYGPITEGQAQALRAVGRNVDRLVGFASDVITLARLESESLAPAIAAFDLGSALREVLAASADTMRVSGVTLVCSDIPEIPVVSDGDMLCESVNHLLSNAGRFAPSGTQVAVGIWCSCGFVRVDVANRGGAIPPNKLAHVFERFYQCEGVDSGLHGGRGIGLAIAQGLARLLGGRIWAENHDDQEGVTFSMEVPLRAPNVGAPAEEPHDRA